MVYLDNMKLFENFNNGKLVTPEKEWDFGSISWSKHAKFAGVELKHIITAGQTGGQYSYHLVRIAPNKKIGLHTHETQSETHEVISGSGTCLNNETVISYAPGTISIFPVGIKHEVTASTDGLYLFAKFFPALC